MKLSALKKGDSAIVLGIEDEELSVKLYEMGCLPGERIVMEGEAPFGDPIAVSIGAYKICIRKKDAESVSIKPE